VTLCVTIFVLSAIATVNQVSAHHTLGEQLPGSIGETLAGGLPVQPTSGAGNGFNRFHIPPDWQGHVSGHIAFVMPGTLYIPPSDQFNYYSPDGSVLTNSVGDLFYICISDFTEDKCTRKALTNRTSRTNARYVMSETYTVIAEGSGYISASRIIVTTWGGESAGQDFYLEESSISIPEFPW
jgi:hypothetical protein